MKGQSGRKYFSILAGGIAICAAAFAAIHTKQVWAAADDKEAVAALDTEYQAAVKKNDATTIARLLADDFILVTGSGKTYVKADFIKDAQTATSIYDHQEDTDRTVRVWGDTAVVTAKLQASGTSAGKPFDYAVWFSDTYTRTKSGWKYVFGQSSLALPKQNP